jgi:hypothetical protein
VRTIRRHHYQTLKKKEIHINMKSLLKRGLLGSAAVAIPVTAALALPLAAHASSPVSNSKVTEVTSTTTLPATVKGNIDIPAGQSVFIGSGTQITGNVTVEGNLKAAGVTFDKNVYVEGGSLTVINQGIHVKHNLEIAGSAGDPNSDNMNGFYNDAGTSIIGGTFSYVGNSAPLYVGLNGGPTGTVAHNFVYGDNTGSLGDAGLTVTGFTSIH